MHLSEQEPVVPALVVDRRRTPERRSTWRGGRRDSDWINRPPGALERFERLSATWSPTGSTRSRRHWLFRGGRLRSLG